jgi:uncharacterized membrane protein YfcA
LHSTGFSGVFLLKRDNGRSFGKGFFQGISMTLLLIYAAVGALAGLIAGLFGLGGGVIMVPAMIYTFSALGMPAEVLTHMAVGTSLMAIVVTSISSVRTHHSKAAVDWPLALTLVPGILVGSWLGGKTAAAMAGLHLQMAFGGFAILVAILMLRPAPANRVGLPGRPGRVVAGGIIGWASALFGIGGGSLSVPFFSFCGVVMQRAVATSAALGLPIAIVGAATFMWQGWGQAALPEWTTGYVYWPAFLGMVVCSAPMAKVGAQLAHRLPAALLKRGFAVFLMLVGAQLLVSGMISAG